MYRGIRSTYINDNFQEFDLIEVFKNIYIYINIFFFI